MAEAKVITNRDDPIPVLVLPELDDKVDGAERILGYARSHSRSDYVEDVSSNAYDGPSTSEKQSKGSAAKNKLKEIQSRASAKVHEKLGHGSDSSSSPGKGQKMQDRLTSLLLQQVIGSDADIDTSPDAKSQQGNEKPNFSLGQMSNNFRRFNGRIGVAFVFQTNIAKLLAWKYPTQTMSLLAIYTFICIEPSMITIVPLACMLYFIMFPAFLARHPPPPSLPHTNQYPLTGPPLAPAATVKPAPEVSKDFFRNMRDLQNSMEDFSRLHDFIIATIGPVTNFSDESVSSALFIALFLACVLLFLTAHLIPWRPVFLVVGWVMIIQGHPTIQSLMEQITTRNQETIASSDKSVRHGIVDFAIGDISLDPSPEKREVEIFELQFRPLYFEDSVEEWTPVSFSPAPYTPLSPMRIAGERPKGTRFFEDVKAPNGWKWADKKWSLDLAAREWVEERMIGSVEVEVEGGRWVVDVVEDDTRGSAKNSRPGSGGSGSASDEDFGHKSRSSIASKQTTTYRRGEWRRRRWVRVVERVPYSNASS